MLLSAPSKRASVVVTLAGSAALVLLAGCSSSGSAGSPESSTATNRVEWSYSGATGPQNWASLSPEYATCGDGKVQSPIDIVNPKQTGNPNPVVAYTATQATVVNSGHDLDMVSPAGNKMTINGKTYEVEEAHFFYGQAQCFAPACGPLLVETALAALSSLPPPPAPDRP